MALTYDKLATTTLGSAAATVTFSTISGSYTDLVLIITGGTDANSDWAIRFNSDTGSNYSRTSLTGDGTAASSARAINQSGGIQINYNGYPQNNANYNSIIYIMNYSNTTTYKTAIGRSNNAGTGTDATVGLWRSTSAITSIDVRTVTAGRTWNSGSTFTLYGILKA
jgi:hypothetical protein